MRVTFCLPVIMKRFQDIPKHIFMKLTAAGIMVFVLFLLVNTSCKGPAYYISQKQFTDSIISFKKYSSLPEIKPPYILKDKQYFIFGSAHTKDPNNPQIDLLEKYFKEFKPTVALVEGRLGFVSTLFMNPVKTYGEGGKLLVLAKKSGIPIYNWDLSKEQLADKMAGKFSAEQIALSQILNPYFSNLRYGKPSSPEEYVAKSLDRAKNVGLEKQFLSYKDVDNAWIKYFPKGPDWRNVSDEYGLPGYLADMINCTNDLRNRQLLSAIKELTAKGEKVFVVCGSSHAQCLSTAFYAVIR